MRIRRYVMTIWWALIGVRLHRESLVNRVLEDAATKMVQDERAWREQAAARIESLERSHSIANQLLWSAAIERPNGVLEISRSVAMSFNNACVMVFKDDATHIRISARRGH